MKSWENFWHLRSIKMLKKIRSWPIHYITFSCAAPSSSNGCNSLVAVFNHVVELLYRNHKTALGLMTPLHMLSYLNSQDTTCNMSVIFPHIMINIYAPNIEETVHNSFFITKPRIKECKPIRYIHQGIFACLWIACLWSVLQLALSWHSVCPKSCILSLSLLTGCHVLRPKLDTRTQ